MRGRGNQREGRVFLSALGATRRMGWNVRLPHLEILSKRLRSRSPVDDTHAAHPGSAIAHVHNRSATLAAALPRPCNHPAVSATALPPRLQPGKLIAATHRDLNQAMQAGCFRADLYYRICADVIRTPTLREQLAAAAGDFGNLVGIVAGRVAGPDAAAALAHRVETWVSARLGPDYSWPGNMRDLEQYVRSILIRGEYTPSVPPIEAARIASSPSSDGAGAASMAPPDPFQSAVQGGTLTGEELLQAYCAQMHLRAGSYEEAARRLDLDPRTVRAKVRAWSKCPRAEGTD
jgi:sigma-54 interacting transcriptional regulator